MHLNLQRRNTCISMVTMVHGRSKNLQFDHIVYPRLSGLTYPVKLVAQFPQSHEIRRKIHRKNATHAKAQKTWSAKLRTKFETLRTEIKAYICDGVASLGNMQISNSRLCESSKCWVYSAVNHPWWMSMLFHRRGLLWLGSAFRYIWWQRWDNDNCQTGVALSMHVLNLLRAKIC